MRARTLLAILTATPVMLCQAQEQGTEPLELKLSEAPAGWRAAQAATPTEHQPGLTLSWRGARWALAPQWTLDASMHRPSAPGNEASLRPALQPGERRAAGLQLKLQHPF